MAKNAVPKLRTCPKRRGGCGRKAHPDSFCDSPWCENYRRLCLTCDCGKYNNHNNYPEMVAQRAAWELSEQTKPTKRKVKQ